MKRHALRRRWRLTYRIDLKIDICNLQIGISVDREYRRVNIHILPMITVEVLTGTMPSKRLNRPLTGREQRFYDLLNRARFFVDMQKQRDLQVNLENPKLFPSERLLREIEEAL